VDPTDTLARAITIALTPWDLDVVRAASGPPGATLPAAEQRARGVAADLRADVVVWVTPGGEQSVLWFYDAESQHVGSRVVDAPLPYDEPTAAAVALTLKTLLRTSAVAPPAERLAVPRARPEPAVHLEAMAGLRLLAPRTAEPRGGIGVAWWTRLAGLRAGLGMAVTLGPGVDIGSEIFTGRYTDASLSPSVRARFDLGQRIVLEPHIGGTLHVTTLDGVVAPDLGGIHASRIDGSLDVGAVIAIRLAANLDVGVFASTSYMTRYQTYTVGDRNVLDLSSLTGELGLRLALGVF